jgi:hypothetical protein
MPEPQPSHSVGVATAQLVISLAVEGGAILYFALASMEKQEQTFTANYSGEFVPGGVAAHVSASLSLDQAKIAPLLRIPSARDINGRRILLSVKPGFASVPHVFGAW